MQMPKTIRNKIARNVAVSLIVYLLPILLMFIYFHYTGRHPWEERLVKPKPSSLNTAFRILNSWGLPVIMIIIGTIEWVLGLHHKKWDKNEKMLDALSFLFPRLVSNPFIAYFSLQILPHLFPSARNIFTWVPFWWGFFIICVFVDLTEYWYHRLHHEVPFLWRFHRSHHSAAYMGMSVAFRTNYINQLLLSPIYLIAALVYLGLGNSLLLFISIRTLITVAAHSSIPWDKPLYCRKWLHPVAWLLERTISTPATHHAHHAASNADGIGNYNGNFANAFFVWDILFKTSIITRKYPPEYGLRHYMHEEWYVQYFWPIVKSRKKDSELSNGAKVFDGEVDTERIPQP